MSESATSRRNVLYGLAAAGVAVPVLAACGSGSGDDVTGSVPDDTSKSTGPGEGIKTSDIPVGGGEILKDQQIVVTQPEAGQFKAFSAVCTHQGCLVSSISDGEIHCSCHGSAYKLADGSVANGPASQPLAEKTVTVTGDTLTVS